MEFQQKRTLSSLCIDPEKEFSQVSKETATDRWKFPKLSILFLERRIPTQQEYVHITIDAEKAAQLGVKFFHDNNVNVMVVGNHDGVIPVAAFRSAIQLEITIENLK